MAEKSSQWWTNAAVLAVVAAVVAAIMYALIYPPKWRLVSLRPNEVDSFNVFVVSQNGATTPRDEYSLPCDFWLVFRRLLASFTKDPKAVGEVYVLKDDGPRGWMPVRESHTAAQLLDDARKGDAKTGDDSHPFPLTDAATWPTFTFYEAGEGSSSVRVSQVRLQGSSMNASKLNVQKLSCQS